jgi:hypothetical protein
LTVFSTYHAVVINIAVWLWLCALQRLCTAMDTFSITYRVDCGCLRREYRRKSVNLKERKSQRLEKIALEDRQVITHNRFLFVKRPTNSQGSIGFLLIRSKFSTPTCFGKWLPSSRGRERLISYSSNVLCYWRVRIMTRPVWPVVERYYKMLGSTIQT